MPVTANSSSRRKVEVRSSGIHGKGVFALRPLLAGSRIVEYTGPIISDARAEKLYGDAHADGEQNHTFLFSVSGGRNIDATPVNTTAKWINHSCDPNCEASEDDRGRVFIEALKDIAAGTELTYDYNIVLESRHTAKQKARFLCRCGAARCRGTLLAEKRKRG